MVQFNKILLHEDKHMFLSSFLLAEEQAAGGCGSETLLMLIILAAVMVVLIILPMFTNRKKAKEINDMRSTLRVGDEIMTIGGIIGKVIKIIERPSGEKDFTIETGLGDKKATMTFDMRALHENRTRMAELREEAARQAEIDKLKKEQRKSKNAEESSVEAEAVEEVENQEAEQADNE